MIIITLYDKFLHAKLTSSWNEIDIVEPATARTRIPNAIDQTNVEEISEHNENFICEWKGCKDNFYGPCDCKRAYCQFHLSKCRCFKKD